MPSFTTNQWAILFLVLLLGWLLGLITRSGGRKWKRAYEAERDARIDEQRDNAAALEAAQARIAELERARPAAAVAPVVEERSVERLDLTRDDLGLIRGVGPAGAARLHEEGLYRFADIAALTSGEEHALEDKLGADRGYIAQEQWREQAELLRDGRIEEHARRFG
jgi:predicted flap endonuclease-1-like 5' DNA nuclease